eukprot:CAMPEP_0176074886 /NCGR_PEP_ID=MMETSP0120_2-20121206/37427_1 /TAXON_ID=160619 /ORGANISM="Kryptoperidinium foliaceum, Strain CCMP 1326" /LENGTH=343 /DNA_ID=CAMNT_0017408587 /DNA_START=45 /DNA_END=1077 /DNA_ORIENTATION=+
MTPASLANGLLSVATLGEHRAEAMLQEFDAVIQHESDEIRRTIEGVQQRLVQITTELALSEDDLLLWEERLQQTLHDNEVKLGLARARAAAIGMSRAGFASGGSRSCLSPAPLDGITEVNEDLCSLVSPNAAKVQDMEEAPHAGSLEASAPHLRDQAELVALVESVRLEAGALKERWSKLPRRCDASPRGPSAQKGGSVRAARDSAPGEVRAQGAPKPRAVEGCTARVQGEVALATRSRAQTAASPSPCHPAPHQPSSDNARGLATLLGGGRVVVAASRMGKASSARARGRLAARPVIGPLATAPPMSRAATDGMAPPAGRHSRQKPSAEVRPALAQTVQASR